MATAISLYINRERHPPLGICPCEWRIRSVTQSARAVQPCTHWRWWYGSPGA